MIIVSCSSKFHAFNLAEQLQQHGLLQSFYTTFAYQKNTIFRKFAGRHDKEAIDPHLIYTNILLAALIKKYPNPEKWNDLYDKWVAGCLKKKKRAKWFIGWSGMSLHSIRAAKRKGMQVIVERGSSHINYQDAMLRDEYRRFGKSFAVNPVTIKKELQEYELADFISIPSLFVKRSFLEYGVPEHKLIINHYGVSSFFAPVNNNQPHKKFKIVYVGTTSIRKGLIYLFRALNSLSLPSLSWEFYLIGQIDDEMKTVVQEYKKDNWYLTGKVNHYDIPKFLSGADVGIQPSLEEGLSMVILQMMSCGVPVIATANTGAENVIEDNINGFIIPVRSPVAIAEKISCLYEDRQKLAVMQRAALTSIQNGFTWNDYGNRYIANLEQLQRHIDTAANNG